RKKKEPIIKALNDGDKGKIQKPALAAKRATDRTLNYNLHLINTPCYTTIHSSSYSTNIYLSTPIPHLSYSIDTHSFIAHNMHLSTPRMLRSTNACSFTSHSNNTNFNDNVFQSNTSNVFYSNISLNDNTDISLTFDAFNDDKFHSNNTFFRSNNIDFTPFPYNIYMSMKALVMNKFNFILPNCNSSMSATSASYVQEDK
ncbi:14996_t:CDS:2, partial [Funneliformis geosporum]